MSGFGSNDNSFLNRFMTRPGGRWSASSSRNPSQRQQQRQQRLQQQQHQHHQHQQQQHHQQQQQQQHERHGLQGYIVNGQPSSPMFPPPGGGPSMAFNSVSQDINGQVFTERYGQLPSGGILHHMPPFMAPMAHLPMPAALPRLPSPDASVIVIPLQDVIDIARGAHLPNLPPFPPPLPVPSMVRPGAAVISSNGAPGIRLTSSDGRAIQVIFGADPQTRRNSELPAILSQNPNFMEQLRNAGLYILGLQRRREPGQEELPEPLQPPTPPSLSSPRRTPSPPIRVEDFPHRLDPLLHLLRQEEFEPAESMPLPFDPISRNLLISYLRMHPTYHEIGEFARRNHPTCNPRNRFRFFNSSPRPDGPRPDPLTLNNILNLWKDDFMIATPSNGDYIGYMRFARELQIVELGIATLGDEYLDLIKDAGDRGGSGTEGKYTQIDVRHLLDEKMWRPVRRRFFPESGGEREPERLDTVGGGSRNVDDGVTYINSGGIFTGGGADSRANSRSSRIHSSSRNVSGGNNSPQFVNRFRFRTGDFFGRAAAAAAADMRRRATREERERHSGHR